MAKSLPSLRGKFFKSYLKIIFLYVLLYVFILIFFFKEKYNFIILAALSFTFLMSTVYSFFLADILSTQSVIVLRKIVESLNKKKDITKLLSKIVPDSIETYILITEFQALIKKIDQSFYEKKKTLLESQDILNAVLECIQDIVILLDLQENVTYLSPCLTKAFEVSTQEILQKKWQDLSCNSEIYLQLRNHFTDNQSSKIALSLDEEIYIYETSIESVFSANNQKIGKLFLLKKVNIVNLEPQSEQIPLYKKNVFIIETLEKIIKDIQNTNIKPQTIIQFKNHLTENKKTLLDVEKFTSIMNQLLLSTFYFTVEPTVLTIQLKEDQEGFLKVQISDEHISKIVQEDGTQHWTGISRIPKGIFENIFNLSSQIIKAHLGEIECKILPMSTLGIDIKLPYA